MARSTADRPTDPDVSVEKGLAKPIEPGEVEAIEVSAGEVAPVEAPPEDTKKFIEHIPREHFDARVITAADWASIGIDQADTEWNVANRFRIPVENLNPKAVEYLSSDVDDGFELVTV